MNEEMKIVLRCKDDEAAVYEVVLNLDEVVTLQECLRFAASEEGVVEPGYEEEVRALDWKLQRIWEFATRRE